MWLARVLLLLLPCRASVLWGAVDREVCVQVEDAFAARSAFCFDFVREEAGEAALRYCAGSRCTAAQAAALATAALGELRSVGRDAEAELRRRFECSLLHNSTTLCGAFGSVGDDDFGAQSDVLVLEKLKRTTFEASELLNGRLPKPDEQCAHPTDHHAMIRACPLAAAYLTIKGLPELASWADLGGHLGGQLKARDWTQLAEPFAAVEFYEHAVACLLRGMELSEDEDSGPRLQLAMITAAWGDLDVAVPLFAGVVAASFSPALARAARLNAAMSVPPIVPDLDDMRHYRGVLRGDLESLSKEQHGAWSVEEQRDALSRVGRTLFHLAHQCVNERDDMVLLAAALRTTFAPDILNVAPLVAKKHDTLRVGFVSAYLGEHSIGKMLGEVIALMANDIDCRVFHVVGALGVPKEDNVRRYLDSHVRAVEVPRSDLEAQRTAIAEAELDVLVFPDVGMEAATYLLAFGRLARVQAVWWGHPTSTGLSSVDYFLSLDSEVEDAQEQYSEQLVRLQHVNTAPFTQTDLKEAMSETLKPLHEFVPNAEPGQHLYVILGRLFKLHPSFDPLLIRILAKDPHGVVAMIAEPQRALTSRLWARLASAVRRELHDDPDLQKSVMRRLVFVDYWNYMHLLANARVVLDTFPYGGCLTALDALSNGLPLVTLPSTFERGRFAMSIYKQMGYEALIASDGPHFVQIATRLATDDTARQAAIDAIRRHYPNAHRPADVAREWAQLFRRWAQHIT